MQEKGNLPGRVTTSKPAVLSRCGGTCPYSRESFDSRPRTKLFQNMSSIVAHILIPASGRQRLEYLKIKTTKKFGRLRQEDNYVFKDSQRKKKPVEILVGMAQEGLIASINQALLEFLLS